MTDKTTADAIALCARRQIDTSALFKQPRMLEIIDNEDVYNFKLRPALQGRLNVPFDGVILSGFIDTLQAQTNKPPRIQFGDPTGANQKGAQKTNAAWERDKKRMRLKMKDRIFKKMAALSGRAIGKYFASRDPIYKPNLKVVDYLDFHCEPNGGPHLDDHYFHWEENIFRSKEDLKKSAETGWYDQKQVDHLIATYSENDFKKVKDAFNNKQARNASLGLDVDNYNYIGGQLYSLVEGDTYYEGVKYHVIMDNPTGIWLRCVPLIEDFGNNLTPFISFASPQEDVFNFWNRGPADRIKPIAEAIRLNLNEILNNNRKRNWDMKAVDKKVFQNVKNFDWAQDKILQAELGPGKRIQDAIYRFETPEISGAINLNMYLNNLAGEKLGVSSQAQGDAQEDKVGIYKGNEIQISKRMKLISDSYEEMYEDLGIRYDWGLWDHATEDEMVQLISADGVGWEKLTKDDKDPDYVISVISDDDDIILSAEEMRVQLEVIQSIEQNAAQVAFVNPKAMVEEKFRLAKFKDEKVSKLLNTSSDVTDELISEAKKAIEMILEGKDPGINYSATTGYIQFISDWILKNTDDLTPEKQKELDEYFELHVPIAMKNKEQKQFNDNLAAGMPTDTTTSPTGTDIPTDEPALGEPVQAITTPIKAQ